MKPNLVVIPGGRCELSETTRRFLGVKATTLRPFPLDAEWAEFAESFPDPRPSVPCVCCGTGVRPGMVDLHRAHNNPALCFSCYERHLEARK